MMDNIRMDLADIEWKVWTACIWLRKGTSEHDNEPSGSIKSGEFLD
jgi:hypothetical protein